MKQIVPNPNQMRRFLDQGLTQAQIVTAWEEVSGNRCSRSAIGMAISRYDLKSSHPKPRNTDLLPWRLQPEHRDHWDARMLRLEGRRRRGDALSDEQLRWLEQWLDKLREQEAVVTYEPRSKKGFFWVPRTEGDADIIRRPAQAA